MMNVRDKNARLELDVQWFPGHMKKALKQISEKVKIIDLFLVVLDSRAPISTYNNMFNDVIKNKQLLFVFSKVDLADKKKVEKIMNSEFFAKRSIALNLVDSNNKTKIIKKVKEILNQKEKNKSILRLPKLMVLGMPNVGKSTLINLLAGQKKVKIANTPGYTRVQTWIRTNDFYIFDTPGVMFPKVEDKKVGLKLAMLGLIKENIFSKKDLFIQSYLFLSIFYPEKIEALNLPLETESKEKVLDNALILSKQKGFLDKDQEINFNQLFNFWFNYLKKIKGITYD